MSTCAGSGVDSINSSSSSSAVDFRRCNSAGAAAVCRKKIDKKQATAAGQDIHFAGKFYLDGLGGFRKTILQEILVVGRRSGWRQKTRYFLSEVDKAEQWRAGDQYRRI